MAIRPVFSPSINANNLVNEIGIEFDWNPGFSIQQKQKNIKALHEQAKAIDLWPLLEISTKSTEVLGKFLSAFNLQLVVNNISASVEAFYQSSKIFYLGGPYLDLLSRSGKEIKRDKRLYESGDLLRFVFFDDVWDLEPKTAFYDWLYINALHQNKSLSDHLSSYKGFTDIEFNPKRSYSCQARSAALFVSLTSRDLLVNAIQDKSLFLSLYLHKLNNNESQLSLPLI